ncbi:MAG: histidinol-phosphate transaminase [Desulfobacterales bacterium]|nr:histidinol-phosphate transaminase [Desulfobacterales bacterium]MDJ0989925.1 histidinol-phosphate transaminase [Desulfobacterales bacterium]
MTADIRLPPHILSIDPYVPGKPIEELERELGIRDSVKLASNENPLGPSPRATAAIRAAIGNLHRYPDGAGHEFVAALAAHLNCDPQNIVMGNGSDDIIALLANALLTPGDRAVMPRPSFLMYEIAVRTVGAEPVFVPLEALAIDLDAILRAVDDRTRLVFVCNPNNPTGTIVRHQAFERFLAALPPSVVVVVDEAYIEFVRDPACLQSIVMACNDRPVVTLRTFSKLYGLAGLRVGYGVMPAALAEGINRIRQPFNVNLLAQVGARAALADRDFVAATLELVHAGLDDLYGELDAMGLTYFPTQSNFFLIDTGRDAQSVFEAMLREGVIVRSMRGYGFPHYIRVNVGMPDENRRLIQALRTVIETLAPVAGTSR